VKEASPGVVTKLQGVNAQAAETPSGSFSLRFFLPLELPHYPQVTKGYRNYKQYLPPSVVSPATICRNDDTHSRQSPRDVGMVFQAKGFKNGSQQRDKNQTKYN